MKDLILGILLLAVCSTNSYADQSRKIQFRTLCLEPIKGLENVVLSSGKDPAKNQEVVLFTDVSPVASATFKTNEAIFYTLKPDSKGNPTRVEAGKATLGKSNRQLFLFIPGEGGEGKLPYHVRAYDDDQKTFAMGSIRAINLSPLPVRFVTAEATTPPIPPDNFAQFAHSKTVNEYNMYPVSVEFQSDSGEWVKGESLTWKGTDKKRDIVIVSEDKTTQVRAIQIFSDFPPWVLPVK